MPAIKLKKAAAEHQAEKEREEREREAEVPSSVPAAAPKPKEAHPGGGLLRGLDTNILLEKRKRPAHPAEQKLIDWMEMNLESKEDCHVNMNGLYDYFGEACSFDGTAVLDQLLFNKRISEKFGKAFALKESSPYKGLIKEKKATQGSKPKVKADSLKIKMKDIIEEAIKEAGNPEKGVRFHSLKQYIACNYPALRVDLRPGYLKAALERGVRYGLIQLVKGVGLAGFYRLPVDEEPDETDEQAASSEEKDKAPSEKGPEQQNGDSQAGEEKPEEEASGAKPKKSRKRKSEEGKGEEKGEKAEGEEGGEGEPTKKKKKKRKHKRRRPRTESYHTAPQKIEDTFALAMTYMCEPKQTSFGKIKKYIAEHYPQVDVESELKPKMESGERKGYWEHVTGQGTSGTFRLLIDEFDPNSTDNIEDMICSAIIACNEPKQASSNLLKRYVMEYHPEFNVESRPHLFKMALERAVKKQMIIQLSGIGASGSFQMWAAFSPSPALLAGEDVSDEEDIFDEKEEAYVPRGTKSRKLAARKTSDTFSESRPKPQKRPRPNNRSDTSAKRKPGGSKARARPKSAKSSARSKSKVSYAEDDEEEEEEAEFAEEGDDYVEKPAPKKARKAGKGQKDKDKNAKQKLSPSKASPKKTAQKPVSRSQLAEAEEEETEASTPKKSKKSKPVVDEEVEEKEPSTPVKSSRGRSRPRPDYTEGKGDDDEDDRKSNRGRKSSGRVSKNVSYSEKDDEDDEDDYQDQAEYTPRKSKSRGGEEETETSTSPKKKGKKKH